MSAMHILNAEFGDQFAQVFKTITVDNGSEFADFTQCESWGTQVFFAHPYTSWERAQNERHNGLFRAFVPKGVSLQNYSAEYIPAAADALKFISYYDNKNKRAKTIDLTKPHKGVLPHTHHGYEHFENDSKKGFANLTTEEKAMVARVRKLWYNRHSK